MHTFKFPRFALLVNRYNLQYVVEGRFLDADKNGEAVYMLTSNDCTYSYSAEYVEATFMEYVGEEENESHK